MTQPRHSAPSRGSVAPAPEGVVADEVWVPPPFEPSRPGDFVEYRAGGFDVKRTHPVRRVVLGLLLVAALAAGGWYFFLRDQGSGVQAMTCSQLHAQLPPSALSVLAIRDGGTLPTGIPIPTDPPGRLCIGTTDRGTVEIAVWAHGSESDYTALLTAGGWGSARTAGDYTQHANGAERRAVITATVDGQLVVMYDE